MDRNNLFSRAVESHEKSQKPLDEAGALSSSWEALYRNLESKQQLFANRVIMETLYRGALGKLNENSYKALDTKYTWTHITPISSRPQSSSYNNSMSSNSTPLASPVQIQSFNLTQTQAGPTRYSIAPQTQSLSTDSTTSSIQEFFNKFKQE